MRSHDTLVPAESEFTNHGGGRIHTMWGTATTGVAIFNGISAEGVDPFYPSQYGSVLLRSWAKEKVDNCLMHPQISGHFHYHIASTC